MNNLALKNFSGLATDSAGIPVYMQSWFTKIITDKIRIHRVTVVEGDEVVGAMTLSLCRNVIGLRQCYNLPWARIGGPLIAKDVGPTRRAEITHKLLDQLPTNASYFLTLSNEHDFKTFLAAGFKAELEVNFKVPLDRATTWEGRVSTMTKRHLRKARAELIVSTLGPDDFIKLYDTHLSMRRRKPYAELSVARDILVEATRRGQASIMTACRRGTGEVDAAVACLWDEDSYYYWMTTRRPTVDGQAKPHQGAVKLLLYKAITDAHAKGLTFDFDGVPSGFGDKSSKVTRLYAGMGAERSVRYRVKRETSLERLASLVRSPIKLALINTIGRFVTLSFNY
jgi:hypothetical protein